MLLFFFLVDVTDWRRRIKISVWPAKNENQFYNEKTDLE